MIFELDQEHVAHLGSVPHVLYFHLQKYIVHLFSFLKPLQLF